MAFRKRFFRMVEISELAVAAISTVIFMLVASGWEAHLYKMYLWGILPYLTFFVISSIANYRDVSPTLPTATCITSSLILVFTLTVYIDGMFIHPTSTSPLMFLFVPIYLLVGGPFTLILVLIILRIRERKNS